MTSRPDSFVGRNESVRNMGSCHNFFLVYQQRLDRHSKFRGGILPWPYSSALVSDTAELRRARQSSMKSSA